MSARLRSMSEFPEEPAEEPKAQVIDLMDALKTSLAAKGESRKPARRSIAKAAGGAQKKAARKRSKG